MYLTALEAMNQTTVAGTTNLLAQAAGVIAFRRLTDRLSWLMSFGGFSTLPTTGLNGME